MPSKISQIRKNRNQWRFRKTVFRVLTVASVAVGIVLSSFLAAAVRTDRVTSFSGAATTEQKFYSASVRDRILIHDNDSDSYKSSAADESASEKERLGEAVANIYTAVASLNLQKYMLSAADPVSAPVCETTGTQELEERFEFEAADDELVDDVPATQSPSAELQPTFISVEETSPTASGPEADCGGKSAATGSKGCVELDENGIPLHFSKILTGIATAYSGDPITATGTVPTYGTVAVNPKIIPFGSLLYILTADGSFVYGVARAEDTGGFIHRDNPPIADLYFETEAECIEFGRRNVIIYVIE